MHPTETASRLGIALRTARETQGLRQDEVALAAGVSVRTVHQLESGKPTSRLDVLGRVARALGMELELRPASRTTGRRG